MRNQSFLYNETRLYIIEILYLNKIIYNMSLIQLGKIILIIVKIIDIKDTEKIHIQKMSSYLFNFISTIKIKC